MRHHLIIIFMALAFATLASCEQDNYDKGEGIYSNLTADFVEAHANSDKNIDYVITDAGDSLNVTNSFTTAWTNTPDSTYRMALYYNKVGGDKIEAVTSTVMNNLSLTPPDSIKEMKTDPIGFESSWTSKNGRYLNLAITLRVGTIVESSKKHKITLVTDSIVEQGDKRTLHLTFFHDKGDIPEYYTQKYYFTLSSNRLSSYGTDSAAIHINTTGSGMKTLRFGLGGQ